MNRLLRWLPVALLLLGGLTLHAQQAAPLPSVTVDFSKAPTGPALSSSLQAVLLLTVLSLAPTILMTATSFTRIVVVMHFLRQGLGLQTTPSNQVLISLSLVLTFFIMAPTAREINATVLQPLQHNQLTVDQAMDRTAAPLKVFMLRYTRKKDLALFLGIAKAP
ncbi:MAG: flagellar biosynthetic protein FliP, partial [Acidobacteriota bacterium]|nr:flagellar biosynthetic protein FliP [Acidobacteriota bacterium]